MYKKTIATFSLSLLMLVSLAQNIKHFSLQQAIDYAQIHSPIIINASLNENIASKKIAEKIAVAMPKIDAGLDLVNNFSLPISFIPGELVGSSEKEIPVQFGTHYSGNATLSLSQILFDGVYLAGLKGARTYKVLSEKEYIKAKTDIVALLSKAYYAVLVSELRFDLIIKNYKRLEILLQETTVMYTNGFAEKIDVSRSKVQFNKIQVFRDNEEKLLQITRSNLNYLLGLPITDSLVLTDKLNIATIEEDSSIEKEALNYSNRIEYSILQTHKDLAFIDKKLVNAKYLPNLNLYATVGGNLGTSITANIFDITNEWYGYGFFGLKMKVPIFDGLQKHYLSQQKKIKIVQIDKELEHLRHSIRLEFRSAKVNFQNAIALLKSEQENMELSKEIYEITKEKYQAGVGSNLEVINADAEYKQSQTNFFIALYNTLITKVDYKKSIGKLL